MTKDQEDAIYSAYLGICVLKTMTRVAKLAMAERRSAELLKELGEAFPFIAERVALSALRDGMVPVSEALRTDPDAAP